MLLSNTLIDPDTCAHLSDHTPCSSSKSSTICQQKYGLPAASEDRHEYLCFITPIILKAGRHSCPPGDLISHLSCIRMEMPANGKQSCRAIGEPPSCCDSPQSHRCQSVSATLATATLCREGSKQRKSD